MTKLDLWTKKNDKRVLKAVLIKCIKEHLNEIARLIKKLKDLLS